jgi:hypothetical protein
MFRNWPHREWLIAYLQEFHSSGARQGRVAGNEVSVVLQGTLNHGP